ncbi:hypothetical protein ACHIPZ_01970 [Antrihabitans sp. NCIMB 15449]|uniref:DUF3558 domain-containing protein n=1 Tax=Antrihabitans spumae TaxID=3373370 RepID=A0ABW7JIL6_9NOCA
MKRPSQLFIGLAIVTVIFSVFVAWAAWAVLSINRSDPAPKSPHAEKELCAAVSDFLKDGRGRGPTTISTPADGNEPIGRWGSCYFMNDRDEAYADVQLHSGSGPVNRVFPSPGEETVLGSSKPVTLDLRFGGVRLKTVLGPWEASLDIYRGAEIDMTRERIEEAAELLIRLTEDLHE